MTKKKSFFDEHTRLRALAMMLVISLVILIIMFFFLKQYGRTGKEYTMPDLKGMTLTEAMQNNAAQSEFIIIDSLYSEGDEGGRILTQDPKAGSQIKKGRKVFISITAFAPAETKMPNVADMSVKQAVSTLSSMGFSVGRLKFVQSQFNRAVLEATCKGKVVSEGATIKGGSVIDLTVGMDPESPYAVVPFVVGRSPEKARTLLKAGLFNVGAEHFDRVNDRSKAVVVKQSPSYTGISQHTMGSTVELWYSDDPNLDIDRIMRESQAESENLGDEIISSESNEIEW